MLGWGEVGWGVGWGSRSDPYSKVGWGGVGIYRGIPSGKYIYRFML